MTKPTFNERFSIFVFPKFKTVPPSALSRWFQEVIDGTIVDFSKRNPHTKFYRCYVGDVSVVTNKGLCINRINPFIRCLSLNLVTANSQCSLITVPATSFIDDLEPLRLV